jgi:hypothetical protein
VYILANRDHAEVRHALLFRAFDLLAGRRPRDWSREVQALYDGIEAQGRAAQAAFVRARVAGTRPALELGRYAGTFADSLNGTVQVSLRDGALHVARGSGYVGRLEHWHYDTFLARWDDRRLDPSPVTFVLDRTAGVAEVRMGGMTFGRVAARNR